MSTANALLKRELRRRIRHALKALPPERIANESARVCAALSRHPHWLRASSVALYAAMPKELSVEALIAAAFGQGKRLFLPRVISKARREMRMLEVHPGEMAAWKPNSWGIREPPADGRAAAPDDAPLDLVVVPGVAFTIDGKRCGHGAGFYDTFLQRCREAGSAPATVAVALSVQIVNELPTDPHDVPIDQVLCADSDSGRRTANA